MISNITELISNCCGGNMWGEPSNNYNTSGTLEGRCNDCKEMSSFTGVVEVTFIKSTYPLGTQDGIDYRINPSEVN